MNSPAVAGAADPGRTRRQLRRTLLRSVSRSFYLSIRLLPRQLREPIALAYLLARTTDTVADTAPISTSVRMETLKLLSAAIQGTASREVVAELVAAFVPLQQNTRERHLLESLARLPCVVGQDRAYGPQRHSRAARENYAWSNVGSGALR